MLEFFSLCVTQKYCSSPNKAKSSGSINQNSFLVPLCHFSPLISCPTLCLLSFLPRFLHLQMFLAILMTKQRNTCMCLGGNISLKGTFSSKQHNLPPSWYSDLNTYTGLPQMSLLGAWLIPQAQSSLSKIRPGWHSRPAQISYKVLFLVLLCHYMWNKVVGLMCEPPLLW